MMLDVDYRRRALTARRLQTFFAVLVLLVMFFPLYWMFMTSLKTADEVVSLTPTFVPSRIQLENYATAWRQVRFLRVIFNTLLVTFGHIFFHMTTGILAAYGFSRGRFKGRDALFIIVLSAMMIPEQVTFIPVYVMIAHLNLIDTYTGLIFTGLVSPFTIFMLRQNFMAIDQSYLDAAKVDGLGIIGTIFHVLVPMSKASMVTVMLISFINGWNSYFWPKIIGKTDRTLLMSVALAKMKNMFEGLASTEFYNVIMAGVAISIVPVVLLFALNQRYMMEGYSRNAMK
ncbi:MAG: carbohydrate ABC transporter permease [Sphaerochaetaceae bacterium]|nr:carbohydrate ABC transporter permease [Spirochaetales bacterium]MDY5500050.1 carbohydrate ABC transporter permease [Sphaerochaetaceae bacterium]